MSIYDDKMVYLRVQLSDSNGQNFHLRAGRIGMVQSIALQFIVDTNGAYYP